MLKIGWRAVVGAIAVLLVGCPTATIPTPEKVGDFSVALRDWVVPNITSEIVAAGKTETKALGLAVRTNTVKLPSSAPTIVVWLVNNTYLNTDGTPKEETKGRPYLIRWNAYIPTATTTSLAGSMLFNTFGVSSRNMLAIDPVLLKKPAGLVVVAQVYPPSTNPNDMGLGIRKNRLAEYKLEITPLTQPFSFAGTRLSAQGLAAHTVVPRGLDLTGKNAEGSEVILEPNKVNEGKATLALASAATAGWKVAFNNFSLGEEFLLTGILGSAPTLVGVGPDAQASDGNAANVYPAGATQARADFTATAGEKGKVTLYFQDRYGRPGTLVVTLDPKTTL